MNRPTVRWGWIIRCWCAWICAWLLFLDVANPAWWGIAMSFLFLCSGFVAIGAVMPMRPALPDAADAPLPAIPPCRSDPSEQHRRSRRTT